MWVSKADKWGPNHSKLSKYFLERLIQQLDGGELITNKHRTTNGVIIVHEIMDLSRATLARQKSINRLKNVLYEGLDKGIPSNIVNDIILRKHFSDIVEYYRTFNIETLTTNGRNNEKVIKELQLKSKIFFTRLKNYYFDFIKEEFLKLDQDPSKFGRNVFVLDRLLNALIPLLLFNGYSASTITSIAMGLIRTDGSDSIRNLLKYFVGKFKIYEFIINLGPEGEETKSFVDLLEKAKYDVMKQTPEDISSQEFKGSFASKEGDVVIKITHEYFDPHTFITSIYNHSLKIHLLKKHRITLQFYTNFFNAVYWREQNQTPKKYKSINVFIDPLNTPRRNSTLLMTLEKCAKNYGYEFTSESDLPVINQIAPAVYYYNLALGSKSIENSMSLLWTALETLVPYHLHNNDIDNVQHFVSKFLSIGSFGRQLNSFVLRFIQTNSVNDNKLSAVGTIRFENPYSTEGMTDWTTWLTTNLFEPGDAGDPFSTLESVSNLLCKQYCDLNETWGGKIVGGVASKRGISKLWTERINSSELSIKYQLDRIYLHRNQIVHTGKMYSEYSNLWSHLEWYVGKLLSYCMIYYLVNGRFNKQAAFNELEGDVQQITLILKENENRELYLMKEYYPILFKHVWQTF